MSHHLEFYYTDKGKNSNTRSEVIPGEPIETGGVLPTVVPSPYPEGFHVAGYSSFGGHTKAGAIKGANLTTEDLLKTKMRNAYRPPVIQSPLSGMNPERLGSSLYANPQWNPQLTKPSLGIASGAMDVIEWVDNRMGGLFFSTTAPLARNLPGPGEPGAFDPTSMMAGIEYGFAGGPGAIDNPGGALALNSLIQIIGKDKFEEHAAKAIDFEAKGHNKFTANALAYEEIELPPGVKIALSIGLDPFGTLLPGGVGYAGGKAGIKTGIKLADEATFLLKNLNRTDPRIITTSQEFRTFVVPKLKEEFINAQTLDGTVNPFDPQNPTRSIGDVLPSFRQRENAERFIESQSIKEFVTDSEHSLQNLRFTDPVPGRPYPAYWEEQPLSSRESVEAILDSPANFIDPQTGLPIQFNRSASRVGGSPSQMATKIAAALGPERKTWTIGGKTWALGFDPNQPILQMTHTPFRRTNLDSVWTTPRGQIIYQEPNVIRELIQKTLIKTGSPLARISPTIRGLQTSLTKADLDDLSLFLTTYGVDPRTSADELLSGGLRFQINQRTGERQFIMGAFDKVDLGGGKSGERFYVTYSPRTKGWGIETSPKLSTQIINTETGKDIRLDIQKVRDYFDNEIEIVRNLQSFETPGSLPYRKYAKQIKALNGTKDFRIRRLKAQPVDVVETRSRSIAEADEIDEAMKVYEDLMFEPRKAGAEPTYKHTTKSGLTHPNDKNPFAFRRADTDYDSANWMQMHRADRSLHDQAMFEFHNANNPTMEHAWNAAVKAHARRLNLPEPPNPPGTTRELGSTPGDPVGALDEVLNAKSVVDEQTLFARYSAARKIASSNLKVWIDDGNEILKTLAKEYGLQRFKGRYIFPKELGTKLLKILHGELPDSEIPKGFESFLEHIKVLQKQEESEYIAYFSLKGEQDIVNSFIGTPNYFPRNWRTWDSATKKYKIYDGGALDESRIPSHLRARTANTFTELLEKGYEPLTYSPLDMMGYRRMQGIQHRETILLLEQLKKRGVAVEYADLNRYQQQYWRVPKVGPAFEGMLVPSKNGEAVQVNRYFVPNKVAGELESQWGHAPKWNLPLPGDREPIDVLGLALNGLNLTKRTILSFSAFQHIDMFTRAGISSSTPAGLRRLAPLKMLPLTARIIAASFYKGDFQGLGRKAVQKRALDETPLTDDFDISFKMIAEEGWNYGGDTSIITRSGIEAFEDISRSQKLKGVIGNARLIKDRIGNGIRFWESGLFEGVYAETQMFMLENFIVPKLRRIHPTETAQQIAARAADEVNVFTSSLGSWQNTFRSPGSKMAMRFAVFSPNETESWLKMASRTVTGDSKRLYQDYWIGYFVWLSAVSNAINYMNTGKFLPLDSYSPLTVTSDQDGNIPFNTRYNSKFMSPEIGYGRNGIPLYLDIVGQGDTPFQWMFSAPSALTSRTSPLVSLAKPFVLKETFYGNPLDSLLSQVGYAALQTLPIGAMQSIEWLREYNEIIKQVIPESETGIGNMGRGLQLSGFNVRKETTKELLNEIARRAGFEKDFFDWQKPNTWFARDSAYDKYVKNLTPSQRKTHEQNNEEIMRELNYRTTSGDERGQEWASRKKDINDIEEEREDLEAGLMERHNNRELIENGMFTWYEQFQDIQHDTWIKKRQTDEVWDLFEDKKEMPKEDLPRARYQWYEAWDEATRIDGSVDWDKLDALREDLYETFTVEQQDHIDELRQKNYSAYHKDQFIVDTLNMKDDFNWYFSIYKTYFSLDNINMYDTYKKYKNSPAPSQFKKDNPEFARHLKVVDDFRKQQRESNLELATTLLRLGRMSLPAFAEIQANLTSGTTNE